MIEIEIVLLYRRMSSSRVLVATTKYLTFRDCLILRILQIVAPILAFRSNWRFRQDYMITT